MIQRHYSWPDGHWDWYQHLAFKHGVRCARMIFVGGQVDKDSGGEPQHVGDLAAQTAVVVGHIHRVLQEFGASLADVTRLTAFYATDGDVVESEFIADVGRHLAALGGIGVGEGPVIVPIPLPWLALPGMRVEIEAIAMLEQSGARLQRHGVSPTTCAALPAPFQHGIRCAEHVFVGAQTRQQREGGAQMAFADMSEVLAQLDAGSEDLVRVGVWHGAAQDPGLVEELDALNAATVVLPTPHLGGENSVRADGWAICHQDRSPLARKISTAPEDWRWPGRQTQIRSVACADMVFVGGQLPLDMGGRAVQGEDLNAQTRLCMDYTRSALAAHGLDLDHMVKQTSYYRGDADPKAIVTNQRLRSSLYREPAGASTGVPLSDFGIAGAMASVDTIAML